MAAPFLRANWRWMAVLNYPAGAESLQRLLPPGLRLETWEGRAWVSVVGLLFEDPSAFGLPVPLHRRFAEVNLRTYARVDAPGPPRRGLVFLGEVVSSPLVALGARLIQNKQYRTAPVRFSRDEGPGRDCFEYSWRTRRRWSVLSAETWGEPFVPPEGSEAEFFTQHYRGFGRGHSGHTLSYEVEHPPWRVWEPGSAFLRGIVTDLAPHLDLGVDNSPGSAYLVEGGPVLVRRGLPIETGGALD